MSFSKWEIRPVGFDLCSKMEDIRTYEVYRVESGGVFNSREDAEHIAYELNKEGKEEK